jgi:hypothetical protein
VARADDRIAAIRDAMGEKHLHGLVAALPANMLLLRGDSPVVGTSLAISICEGAVVVLFPEDLRDLAGNAWPTWGGRSMVRAA